MRVLVIAGSLRHTQAGAAHATLDFVNRLAAGGDYNVRLAVTEFDESSIHQNVEVVQYDLPKPRRFFWRFKYMTLPGRFQSALRRLDLRDVDVCYAQGMNEAIAFRRLYPGVPVITHTGAVIARREYREAGYNPGSIWGWMNGVYIDSAERMTYLEPRWSHIVSTRLVAEQRAEYFNVPVDRFHVAPLGIDCRRFDPSRSFDDLRASLKIPREAVVVCTAARLVAWKRVDMVVRAVARSSRRDVHLLVAGDGAEKENLQKLALELKVDDRVHFLGHMRFPEVCYSASDIFVLPSEIESFGLVYAEAMAMGLPCIGRRNSFPEIVSTASDVIPEGVGGYCVQTEDELVDRVNFLAENTGERMRLSAMARDHSRNNYSTDRYSEFVRALIDQQLKRA